MNQIIGWIVVLLMLVVSVYCIYRARRPGTDYDCRELFWVPAVVLFLSMFIYPITVWYAYKVALPNEYQAVVEAIDETKELVQSGKQWNLEDIEIHKRLSELIKEKADYRALYRMALRNPFVLFKPEPLE